MRNFFEFRLYSEILGCIHGDFFGGKVVYCPHCTYVNDAMSRARTAGIDYKPHMMTIAPDKIPAVTQSLKERIASDYFWNYFKGRMLLMPPIMVIKNKLTGEKAVIFGSELENIKKALSLLISSKKPEVPLGVKLAFEKGECPGGQVV